MAQTPQQFAQSFGMIPPTTPATPAPSVPSQYILQVTIAGQRWDSLAWQYYGDATLINPIIMANPSVPIEPEFAAGISIQVPILQQAAVTPVDLPPWDTL